MQLQSVIFALPAGESAFMGHCEHTEAPADAENLPAPQLLHGAIPPTALNLPLTHEAHVPPLGPDHPALQLQAFKAELPTGE